MDNGDTDGSANWNKKSVIAQKEPKSKAKLLAEKEPRSKIPDSEIHPENIMIGSPIYIPYKKILKSSQGCGQFGKKIKFPTSSSLEMPQQKWTLTKKEMEAAKWAKKLASAKFWKTKDGGKDPCKALPTKVAHKANQSDGKPPGVKQPYRHKPGTVALWEIWWFQKSVALLIPLLPFGRLIREITQDFRKGLRFQSGAVLTLQGVVETFLVNFFEATNLCAIHRQRQTIAPKDFSLVKAIHHISGINMWWM